MTEDHPSADLAQRILEVYGDMPKSERRLADLLLANPSAIAVHSATELSDQAGISKATTARLFRRLGYPSFRSAQRAERRDEAPAAPAGRGLAQVAGGRIDLGAHLTSEVQNLVRTTESLRSDELNEAILHIARADKVWVVGFGDNYPLAHFARALLIRVKPDIRMIPIGGFSVPEEFASIKSTDAMLALGIGRKPRSLRSIMRSAIGVGAQVVLVTDQHTRASAELAGVTLRCRTRNNAVFDSVTAPVSLLTFLCAAIAVRIGQAALERLQMIDGIHEDWDDLLSGDI